MYVVVVPLTMLVMPIISVLIQHAQTPTESLVVLTGRWFVFWGVGVRLGLAGLRQIVQPRSPQGISFKRPTMRRCRWSANSARRTWEPLSLPCCQSFRPVSFRPLRPRCSLALLV